MNINLTMELPAIAIQRWALSLLAARSHPTCDRHKALIPSRNSAIYEC
jgi:hypothetical protein